MKQDLTPALTRGAASTAWLRLSVVAAACAADWAFYRQPFGWLHGALPLLAGVLFVMRPASRAQRAAARPGLILLVLSAGAIVHRGGRLAPLLVLLALAALAASRLGRGARHAGEWLAVLARVPGLVVGGWFRDRRAVRRHSGPWHRTLLRLPRLLGSWVLPAILGGVFLILFAVANPIIARGLSRALGRLADALSWLRIPSFLRLLFWLLNALLLWGFWRIRGARRRARAAADPASAPPPLPDAPPLPGGVPLADQPALAVRCLAVFNAVFLLETAVDLVYLWGGRALPAGLSLPSYAHRGAYPLVATALLSGALMLTFFKPGHAVDRHRAARHLLGAWLLQNVLLTASAAWRLHLYIDACMLTRLRVEALVWMGLVAFGLLAIGWRIARGLPSRWLVDVNAIALLLVFVAWAWWPADAFIARYNVRHCREAGGHGQSLDLAYLRRLGPEAIPALRTHAAQGAASSAEAGRLADLRAGELRRLLRNPRAWTWRRAALLKAALRRAPTQLPPDQPRQRPYPVDTHQTGTP